MDRGAADGDFYSNTTVPLLHPGLPPNGSFPVKKYQRTSSPLSPTRSLQSLGQQTGAESRRASDRPNTTVHSSRNLEQHRRNPSSPAQAYAAANSPRKTKDMTQMSQRSSSMYDSAALSNEDLISDNRRQSQTFRGYRQPDESPVGTPLPAASYDDGSGSRSTSFASHDHLKGAAAGSTAYLGNDEVFDYPITKKRSNKKWWCLGALIAFVVIVAAIVLGVYFGIVQPNNDKSAAASANKGNANQSSQQVNGPSSASAATATVNTASATSAAAPTPTVATSGSNGSTVTMANGTTFIYTNQFGGNWTSVPFDNSAQAQSYTPSLAEPWNFATMKIRGVNIGGWLVTEPFIAPALYEPYVNAGATDEYSLSVALGANAPAYFNQHYATFITEQDFAAIAGAGLNWVRIPIGYWALEVLPSEPFVPLISWQYFLQALGWARKYGLRVNLDFHALPGSQNSWNHSGKGGAVGFLNGVLGVMNAQRGLNYMRELAEFIAQPQYKNLVPIFGPINEPEQSVIGETNLRSFYVACYNIIREVTGTGPNVQQISLHDAFDLPSKFYGFLNGGNGVALDSHKYLVFGSNPQTGTIPSQINSACNTWAQQINTTLSTYGLAIGGEFSGATDDCGQWINGVGQNANYASVLDCTTTTNWWTYTAAQKQLLNSWIKAQMDIFNGNFFFWTWKTGPSAQFGGRIANPVWSYQLGLQQGWILPTDPTTFEGTCNALNAQYNWGGLDSVPFNGVLPASATGASGVSATPDNQGYSDWPSQSAYTGIGRAQMAFLPTWTPTGPLTSLPTPTIAGAETGWANPSDTTAFFTQVAGCPSYPAYSGRSDAATPLDVPTAACTGTGAIAVTDVPAGTVQAANTATVTSHQANHGNGNIVLPTATATKV